MYSKGDACSTCCRNCFLMHRKKHDICSFFKIMFAETFDKLLVLPPIFAKKLKSLEGRKMTLEDSNRRTWDVLLSDVEGALAFQKGWRNFALDHNIERCDLLVFCHVGNSRFLVEIYGRSGCQKKVTGMNKNRTEATKTSLPKKRPSQSFHEQSAPKRHKSSYAFPGPNIDVTPRPKNVHVVKDRPIVFPVSEPMVESSFPEPVMESSFRTNRDKNMLNGISVAETHIESCSMVNREKKRPKMIPVPEALVDPCTMTNRDKSRPNVVQLDESLVEPCFMTTRDENFTVEDDRKCLFELSVFEMPGKLSTIDKEDETNYLLDFPVYDLPENEAGAGRSGGPLLLGSGTSENTVTEIAEKKTTINRDTVKDYILNKSAFEMPENEAGAKRSGGSLLLGPGTSENTVTEITDKKTTINRDDVKDYILNKSTFEMPENEYANASNKCQLHENLQYQEPDHYQNAESEAALINFPRCQITERKTKIEASDVDLPADTIMPLNFIFPKTAELSAVSGSCQNLMLNNQETRSYQQKVCGHTKDQSFLGASSSVSEQNYGDLEGNNIIHIKQESSKFKEFKQDLCGHATKNTVKIEESVNKIVKLEPVECDASATAVKVICSDSQDYLELPEPLPVAFVTTKSTIKFNQQLLFLRDPHKRLWPVIYHRPYGLQVLASGWKSFMKANYIGRSDQCSFTLEDSLENTCNVQIDYLSQD
ncbi:uncharacterized protein LOC141627187 [Silene latifolia]|uniref:uncharacterized protein LOC141627187 n=1 Tax=Silene latifolia TaxID=37657 RepID=UPI003D781052